MSTFQPPPTYEAPFITDERTGQTLFSPNWLRWFGDLVKQFQANGTVVGSGTGDEAGYILAGQVFGA